MVFCYDSPSKHIRLYCFPSIHFMIYSRSGFCGFLKEDVYMCMCGGWREINEDTVLFFNFALPSFSMAMN